MNNSCSNGSCSMKPMASCGGSSACQSSCGSQSSCGCKGSSGCGSQGSGSYLCDLKEMTQCAKKALLKEKIKDRLEAKMGDKLNSMADLAVEMYLDKWEHKQARTQKKSEYQARLSGLMQG